VRYKELSGSLEGWTYDEEGVMHTPRATAAPRNKSKACCGYWAACSSTPKNVDPLRRSSGRAAADLRARAHRHD
jgi:hypothetical protein